MNLVKIALALSTTKLGISGIAATMGTAAIHLRSYIARKRLIHICLNAACGYADVMILRRIQSFATRVRWALRKRTASADDRRHIVFRFEVEQDIPAPPENIRFTIDVSVEDASQFLNAGSVGNLIQAKRQLPKGARLAVAARDGLVLSSALYRRVDPWMIDLNVSDVVIYSVVTEREAMGMGLAGHLARMIARKTQKVGGDAYVDCVMWNLRAHRAFEKVGFRRIGYSTFPPMENAPE